MGQWGNGATSLICVKAASENLLRDKATRLSEDCLEGSDIELPVPRNGESLVLTISGDTPEFRMAATLGNDAESERFKDSNHLDAGKPPKSGHPPTPARKSAISMGHWQGQIQQDPHLPGAIPPLL